MTLPPKVKPINNLDNIVGYIWNYDWSQFEGGRCDMTRNDFNSINLLLQKIKRTGMSILEIGTSQGSSAVLLGAYAKCYRGKLYTVDSYVGNYKWFTIFENRMKNFALTQSVTQLHMSSERAFYNLKNLPDFDIIFLDGNHTYEGIKQDIKLWGNRVKKGGILCGHDCELFSTPEGIININTIPNWTKVDIIGLHIGVIKAVSEIFKDKAHILGDRIWWVQK